MKLKNKTALRKEILSREGTTGWFDYLSIDHNGNWTILNANTIQDGEYRVRISKFETVPESWGKGSKQRQITNKIREVEWDAYNFFGEIKSEPYMIGAI